MLRHINLNVVGKGHHRSGWPYCLEAMQPLFSPDSTVLFDDFVERTYLYDKKWDIDRAHKVPWIGVMHHPPDMPLWYMDNMRLQRMIADENWQIAAKQLKLIITMGDNLRDWCQTIYPEIPSVSIKHPTGRPMLYWTPERFRVNEQRKLVQVGWFLRNTTAIYDVHQPKWLTKAHLSQHMNNWSNFSFWQCKKVYGETHPERKHYGETKVIKSLNDTQYDILMAENVVFVELLSAVANNTVVECIARNTPICINRHPGPEGYLGRDYPLFYEHFDDVESLLTMENIMAAHEYLVRMDKWWIRGSMFREQVRAACIEHVPACRVDAERLPVDYAASEI